MGPAVLAGVRARTWLVEHSDDDLLAVAWRCAPDVTEERHGLPAAEDPSIILLRQGRPRQGRAAHHGDGRLCQRLRRRPHRTSGVGGDRLLLDVSDDELRASAVPVIRELVADGLLVRDE